MSVSLRDALGAVLLDVGSHEQPQADEQVPAAVLVALYEGDDEELHVVLTKRRADLRRHAGEISFPGGRRDPEDDTLVDTALREAEEEIGLLRTQVSLMGALEQTSTFVTNYAIHPFVGVIEGKQAWRASTREVEQVIEPSLREVHAGRTRTQIERRGFRFETDAYVFNGQLVWGATARILEDLLGRVEPLLSSRPIR